MKIYFRVCYKEGELASILNSYEGAMGEFEHDGPINTKTLSCKTKVYEGVPLLSRPSNKDYVKPYLESRKKLLKNNEINNEKFLKDTEFDSPDEAGGVITCRSISIKKAFVFSDAQDGEFISAEEFDAKFATNELYPNETNRITQSDTDLSPKLETKADNNFKNIILYGPPGTGKTYNSAIYATKLCAGKISLDEIQKGVNEQNEEFKYDTIKCDYKNLIGNQIRFTTFHQSYGYEEFIEGIKPVAEDDNGNQIEELRYEIIPGVFKKFCRDATPEKSIDDYINDSPTIWKVSLDGTGESEVKKDCFKNGYIRLDYPNNEDKSSVNYLKKNIKIGDIVCTNYSETEIDGIGVITGDYFENDSFNSFKRMRNIHWLVTGIKEDISKHLNKTKLGRNGICGMDGVSVENIKSILMQNKKNYVFIIDEINRGNISKIFGELITLIEDSKRAGKDECVPAILPYSKKEFSVPDNVYILGTMNTADRSIAMMDTALRRRFQFIEMMPETKVLEDKNIKILDKDGKDTNINIPVMLKMINDRIEVLYDREHTIGHAYFCDLTNKSTIDDLANIFRNKIIPLLQEYFYDDYEKIRLVLGDNQKNNRDIEFINKNSVDSKKLFGIDDYGDEFTYSINEKAFKEIESYLKIYPKIEEDEKKSNQRS